MMINNVIEKTPQKPWTRDQELAINTTDKGVVVSAAAGSGKTAVLIERTIKMLINPEYNISADTLLAVTFTNDAANQMKSKLSQAMIRCLEEDPQNEWIAKQQELLSLANICTIDAFCLNLVKNNINQFELAGNFSMIGDEENKILIENSFEEASEYFFKNEPQTMKILMDNFANENDGNVLTLAKELMKFIGSIPFKNQWKNMVISKLENVDVEEYMSSAVESFKPLLGNLKIISEETLENVLKVKEPVIKNLENDIFGIKNILDESSSLSYDERLTGASKILTKSAISKVLVGDIEKNFKESLKEYKKRATVLKNEFKKLGFYYEAQITNDANRTKIVFEALWKFTEKAESLINEYKLEKNKMYFNDITRMTIELLAVETDKGFERTPLAQKMVDDKLYKIILIDEFQDVNNLQEVIFNCISDTDDLNQLGKNVFVVGDMKQSIYKFRQSNPRIFDKAREYASNEESVNNALIVLKKNFRSRSNIIDFTNFVFENIMSKEFGEVDYCGNGGSEKLELGAKYDENNPKTEILLIKTNLSDTDKKTKLLDNKLDHECKACALKIKKMISDKVQVYISENETRDCRPGDFCILSRTGKKFKDYIQALESVGIKGVTDSVQGFLGAREISLALSLMKIIDNPMQDIPFAAVCLSPVFAFTPDELSKIRLSKKGSKLYQLFLAICRDDNAENFGFAPININDDVIEEKCKNAISILKRLRFFAAGMSLERLIRKLFDVTDFMSIASSFENSQQKRANLRMLIKYASDFEKATGGGLSNFLRYMDNVAKTDNDFNEALTVTAGEDAVAIKTIHKSKGLEYPFVIVGNLSGASSKKDLTRQFIVNEISGVGIKLRNKEANSNLKTYFYDVVYNANVSESCSEELRILYVALTRAKERLILPMEYSETKAKNEKTSSSLVTPAFKAVIEGLILEHKLIPSLVMKLDRFRDLIAAALLVHPQRKEFLDFLSIEDNPKIPIFETNSQILFELVDLKESDTEKSKEYVIPPVNTELFGKITKNLEYKESQEDIDTISKLSVTELVEALIEGEHKSEISYFSPIPNMITKEKKATAAEKGTDTHLFMEIADFDLAFADVKKELDRLVQEKKMTDAQAKNVNLSTVEKFFTGELYKRCQKAMSVLKEKKFMTKLSDMTLDKKIFGEYNEKDVIIQGIADLLIEEADGYVLVDYKTDNVKEASELIKRHSVQLMLYKSAFELVLDKPIKECFIYSFKLETAVRVNV